MSGCRVRAVSAKTGFATVTVELPVLLEAANNVACQAGQEAQVGLTKAANWPQYYAA
jgi:TldD protein